MSDAPPKKRKRKEVNPLPWVILVIALLVAGIWAVSRGSKGSVSTKASEDTITITLPPPPPPVTPPPPPPPPENEPPPPEEEEEMLVEEDVTDDEEPPEEPSDEPPPDIDLGPGSAGGTGPAIGGGGKGGSGIGGTGRRGSGSKYGWYNAKLKSTIREKLTSNSTTRSATLSLQVRIWVDANGRVTRSQLIGTSGNPAVDQAIKNQILTGTQLHPPPPDMRMPINLRLTGRKP